MDCVLLTQDLVTSGAVFWDATSRSLIDRLPNYLTP